MTKRRRSRSLDSGSWSDQEIAASPSDSEFDNASFELKSKHFPSKQRNKATTRKKPKNNASIPKVIEHERGYVDVPLHTASTHVISSPQAVRGALLNWYQTVQNIRGMPWRRLYNANLGSEERAQRAYEVFGIPSRRSLLNCNFGY